MHVCIHIYIYIYIYTPISYVYILSCQITSVTRVPVAASGWRTPSVIIAIVIIAIVMIAIVMIAIIIIAITNDNYY